MLGEPEPGSDAAALSKLRGHWLLPAVGKPAAAAVLADLKVQRIADGEWLQGPWQQQQHRWGAGDHPQTGSSGRACAAQRSFWLRQPLTCCVSANLLQAALTVSRVWRAG